MTDLATHQEFVALRKAAILAHWLPGLSLLIRQQREPVLAVTTESQVAADHGCGELHPCEFRRQVIQMMTSDRAGLPPDFGDGGLSLQIEVVTGAATTFDNSGLVITMFDRWHSVVGFPTLSVADPSRSPLEPGSCQWPLVDAPVAEEVDLGLGAAFVCCTYPTSDPRRADLAYAAVFEEMIGRSAAEVVAQSLLG